MPGSTRIVNVTAAHHSCVTEGLAESAAAMRAVALYLKFLDLRPHPCEPDPAVLRWLVESRTGERIAVRTTGTILVVQPAATEPTPSASADAEQARVDYPPLQRGADQGDASGPVPFFCEIADPCGCKTGGQPAAPEGENAGRMDTGDATQHVPSPSETSRAALPARDKADRQGAKTDRDVWRLGERLATRAQERASHPPAKSDIEDRPATAIARVLKMKRHEIETALRAGLIEAEEADDPLPPEPDLVDAIREIVAAPSLSAKDAEALATELAQIETESRALGQPARSDLSPDARPSSRAKPGATVSTTLDRLLDETTLKLGEPAGHRRRATLSHLKAAAAAVQTNEGPLLLHTNGQEAAIGRFRGDLEQVLQPAAPPGPHGNAVGRGAAPLVLGAEYRVSGPADGILGDPAGVGASSVCQRA